MARAGLGRDVGADDAGARHQHHREVLDAKKILATKRHKKRKPGSMQTVAPKIELPEKRDEWSAVRRSSKVNVSVQDLNFFYGRAQALNNISIEIPERIVMAFIGPSGCGKSTFLRTLNRMNDVIPATRVDGKVLIDDHDLYGS